MGTTPNMAIPYPESSDFVADGATAMKNLAEEVDDKTGLVHVKTTPIVVGTAAQTVTNAFSSTFRNYRIIVDDLHTSSNNFIYLRFGSVLANYYGGLKRFIYTGTESFTGSNAASEIVIADGTTQPGNTSIVLDVYSPNAGTRTLFTGMMASDGNSGVIGGMIASATVFTDFYIGGWAGITLQGGTIRVYGYTNG